MLKNLIRAFSNNVISPAKIIKTNHKNLILNNIRSSYCTQATQPENNHVKTTTKSSRQHPFDADEYLVPYQSGNTKWDTKLNKYTIFEELSAKFRMSDKDIHTLFNKDIKLKQNTTTKDFQKVIDVLLEYHITKKSILENPSILEMSSRVLKSKLDLLHLIQHRDINDFVKFLKLPLTRLQNLMEFLRLDAKMMSSTENRFYYICDRLNLKPEIVASYLSKRIFMLQIPFDTLQANLNYMIQYGVHPLSILKDLWAFRYKPKSVKARLERAKKAKKDKIMPWMIRCPERILQKSLKLSIDEKKLLGDNNTIIDYLSARLGYDPATTKAIMDKHPAVLKVRATKIKEVLDYLLDEEQLSPHEIGQVPRILCHSLGTTKKRFEELKSVGCQPSSLIILCRSRREYDKFLNSWIEISQKLGNKFVEHESH